MTGRRAVLWACLIVVLAGFLRARRAAQRESLWGDEAQDIAIVAASDGPADVWTRVQREGHPPLHYWVEWLVQRRFGQDVAALRGMTALFGTLTVFALMLLGWRAFGPRCALLAGFLAATSPYLVHYTTEVRSYALFGLLAVLHAAAYLRFLRRNTFGSAALWGVAAAALAYCHYYAFPIALTGGVYALARDPRRATLLRVGLAGLVGAVLFAPWLPHFMWQMGAGALHAWYEPQSRLAKLLSILFLPAGKWGAILVAWALARSVVLVRRADGVEPREAVAFRGLFWLSVGAAGVAWVLHLFRGGNYLPRYLMGMAVPLFLPVSLYWSRMGEAGDLTWRGLRTGKTYTLPAARRRRLAFVLVGVALLAQYTDPSGWRRQPSAAARLAARVERHERPGDIVLVSPAWFALPFRFHYGGRLPVLAPPYRPPLPAYIDHADLLARCEDPDVLQEFVDELGAHLDRGARVWLVALGSFPLDSEEPFLDEPAPKRTPPLVRAQRAMHKRFLRLLYERARAAYWLEGPAHEYITPLTLVLFQKE